MTDRQLPEAVSYSRESTPERTPNRQFGDRNRSTQEIPQDRWRRYSQQMEPAQIDRNLVPATKIHGKSDSDSKGAGQHANDLVTNLFYRPRSITFLVFMLLLLLYLALFRSDAGTFVENVKRGILVSISVFVFIGIHQFADGPFIRPHPAMWRGVLAISISYLLFLVFVLFQNADDARRLLGYYDSTLGHPLPERSYAEDCSLNWDVMVDQFDIFIIAHVLGWFGKALILRDQWLCWVLSIMFEVLEYSLEHQLPNFAECWWDHWLLDVLICNWIGIYFGMKTCEYYEMKTYSWRSLHEIEQYKEKIKRTVEQFTPYSWTKFEWAPTQSPKNFFAVLILIIVFLQCELNAFYLKAILWVPPEHYFNSLRLVIFFLIGIVAVRELYQFLTDRNCRRLGFQAWLAVATIQIESIICFKFGGDIFQKPTPPHVLVFWALLVSFLVLFCLYKFVFLARQREAEETAMQQGCKIGGGGGGFNGRQAFDPIFDAAITSASASPATALSFDSSLSARSKSTAQFSAAEDLLSLETLVGNKRSVRKTLRPTSTPSTSLSSSSSVRRPKKEEEEEEEEEKEEEKEEKEVEKEHEQEEDRDAAVSVDVVITTRAQGSRTPGGRKRQQQQRASSALSTMVADEHEHDVQHTAEHGADAPKRARRARSRVLS